MMLIMFKDDDVRNETKLTKMLVTAGYRSHWVKAKAIATKTESIARK